MPLDPTEAAAIALKAADLTAFLTGALRKDDDGIVRLNPDEARTLLRKLTTLAALVARDALD